jgi:cytochrome c
MEFFDSLVLHQSQEHIALLNYILMVVYFIFLPFSGLMFSGTIISVYFKRRGEKEGNKALVHLAKEIIQISTINKNAGFILGVAPSLAILLIYIQLLHSSGSYIISFLFFSFMIYLAGVIFVYLYRYTMILDEAIVSPVKSGSSLQINEDLARLISSNEKTKNSSGIVGITLLLIAMLLVFGSISLSINTNRWNEVQNVFSLLFSLNAWLSFLFFTASSFTLTAGFILFRYFYWGKNGVEASEEIGKLLKRTTVKIIFVFALAQPLILLAGLFLLPDFSLSTSVFYNSVISVILVFLALNFTYLFLREGGARLSGYIFILFICVFSTGVVKDQLAMLNATTKHSVLLNTEYEKYIMELKEGGGAGDFSAKGEQIYKKICSTCHKFDQKLVGPPYKETLPKYEGKMDALVSFISNPVKINASYPAMPNQGLKPNEAKAVAQYLMSQYKK